MHNLFFMVCLIWTDAIYIGKLDQLADESMTVFIAKTNLQYIHQIKREKCKQKLIAIQHS